MSSRLQPAVTAAVTPTRAIARTHAAATPDGVAAPHERSPS